jgi:FkbM family methyltransferase
MRDQLVKAAKAAAGALGYEVHRSDLAHPGRRAAAMKVRGIDVVLDVGANRGQYVEWLRAAGYDGRIVSFEPIPSAFEAMAEGQAADPRWQGHNLALGATAGSAVLHVAESPVLSSLLQPGARLRAHIPQASTVREVTVPVAPLDDVWKESVPDGSKVMLKIDTQGYEHLVLDGAAEHLSMIQLVEVEMSLVNLYEGGSSIFTLLPRLKAAGFEVVSINSGGYIDSSTGQVLDVDVLAGRPLMPDLAE